MPSFWALLAEHNGTGTAYAAAAGAGAASPYSPVVNGRLKAIRCVVGRDAASSLIDHYQFKLSCSTFTPNAIECGITGSGLQTAPALQSGEASKLDWIVDQPVQVGATISVEGRALSADTQVTPVILVYGLFETSSK